MKIMRGFTLIELLVTVSILAILMAVAVPSFESFFSSNRVATATSDFVTNLNLARSESIRRGVQVSLRNTGGSGNWGGGWSMFVDNDRDGVLDTGEESLRTSNALSGSTTIYGNANFTNAISFTPTGRITNSVGGTFVVCHNDSTNDARSITVSGTGRVRVDSTGITDCLVP